MTDNDSKQQPHAASATRVFVTLLIDDRPLTIHNVSGTIPGLTPNGGQFHGATVCRDRRGHIYLRHPQYFVDEYGETDELYDVRLTARMLLLLLSRCTTTVTGSESAFSYDFDSLPEISDEEFTRLLTDAADEVCKINNITPIDS